MLLKVKYHYTRVCENYMKTNGIFNITFFHRRHALINVN